MNLRYDAPIRNAYGFTPYRTGNYHAGHQEYYRGEFAKDVRNGRAGNWTASKRKHSGAKFGVDKNGKPYISAWNYSRRLGLVNVFIAPYSGTYKTGIFSSGVKEHISRKTNVAYQVWMCKITGKGIDFHAPVFVTMDGKRASIKDGYNWVVNCNAPNGGYCGQGRPKNGRR